jgi:hypothetical protein
MTLLIESVGVTLELGNPFFGLSSAQINRHASDWPRA